MEYSKDIALGVKYFNVEDNVEVKIQKENKEDFKVRYRNIIKKIK